MEKFGNKDYVLESIHKELNVQFNTQRQILLIAIYAFISQERKMFEDYGGISMYGTTTHHDVGKNCTEIFDNKLNITLIELQGYNG